MKMNMPFRFWILAGCVAILSTTNYINIVNLHKSLQANQLLIDQSKAAINHVQQCLTMSKHLAAQAHWSTKIIAKDGEIIVQLQHNIQDANDFHLRNQYLDSLKAQ